MGITITENYVDGPALDVYDVILLEALVHERFKHEEKLEEMVEKFRFSSDEYLRIIDDCDTILSFPEILRSRTLQIFRN